MCVHTHTYTTSSRNPFFERNVRAHSTSGSGSTYPRYCFKLESALVSNEFSLVRGEISLRRNLQGTADDGVCGGTCGSRYVTDDRRIGRTSAVRRDLTTVGRTESLHPRVLFNSELMQSARRTCPPPRHRFINPHFSRPRRPTKCARARKHSSGRQESRTIRSPGREKTQ